MTLMTREMITLLPFVLRHCPKLYDFSGSFHSTVELDHLVNPPNPPPSMMKISSINYHDLPLPQIQALRLNPHIPNFDAVQALSEIWPDVKHLVLFETALDVLDKQISNSSSKASIEELKLSELKIGKLSRSARVRDPELLLYQLCKSSIGHLCVVDLGGVEGSLLPRFDSFFKEHARHLRSLRLPTLSQKTRVPHFHHCTSLEELSIQGYPTLFIRQDCPISKLTHVSFTSIPAQAKYPLKAAVNWIKTMPNLRVLTWTGRVRNDERNLPKDSMQLQELCEEMQVRLRLSVDTPVEVSTII
jgi:hypothetical protein